MKYFLLSSLLVAGVAQAQPTPRPAYKSAAVSSSSLLLKTPPSPRQLYPGLFEAVQLNSVYADNKTFVDALPTAPPAEVVAAYERQHNQPGFDLKTFVGQYFKPPVAATDVYRSNVKAGIRAHLDTLWTVLRRPGQAEATQYSSLLPLPHPYLVPGCRPSHCCGTHQ
jgi:alpha,alpha-trehalase